MHNPLKAQESSEAAGSILDAATELFAERGFEATPMSAIAERAGVSKGNIFHHYGCKNDLYVAVMSQASANTARLLAELTRESGPFAERIRNFARAHLDYLLRNQCVSRLILHELAQGDVERGRQMVHGAFGENFATLVSIFEAGQRDGIVRRELDPAVMAMALLAGNVFFFQSRFLLPHMTGVRFAADPDFYSRSIVEIFLHGILATAS
jgi:TetR/AcrR family transcriptional regulator